MDVYTSDIVERKQLARQAKYRKCGSKSKKCSLSTDNMTNKQWKERCGTVQTYSMNEPKTWEQFKGLPADIQKQYINFLFEKYNVSAVSLAEMFGKTAITVRNYIEKQGLGITFRAGNKMNKEQRAAWERFLANEDDKAEDVEGHEEDINEPAFGNTQEAAVTKEDAQDMCSEDCADPNPGMAMRQFSMTFEGKIDVNMIANSIRGIVGKNATGKIEIMCTL